jgi:AmpD protein
LSAARWVASPNCDDRPADETVRLVVIHAISLPPREFGGPGIIQLFTNSLEYGAHPYYLQLTNLRVSAHFLIRRDGELIQFVACSRRAWHAGISNWRGQENCNNFSMGIELEGCDELPFEDAQYRSLNQLLAELEHRFPIEAVVAHSDIAPGRKTDPGPCFDWRRVNVASR